MENSCRVSLVTKGKDQVLKIPHEFALSGTEVVLRKEGDQLIIEPISDNSLLSMLRNLPDISDDFPDVDEGLLTLDDIKL
ncbi:MAG: AbrB/MazE/SpoVT family DNA-binding domain-containing protein [Cyanobacteria bacterium P01_F01_bin.143]